MKRTLGILAALLLVWLVFPHQTQAQIHLAPQAGFHSEQDLFLGAQLHLDLENTLELPLFFIPAFEVYLQANTTRMQFDLNLVYKMQRVQFSPYIGAGAAVGYVANKVGFGSSGSSTGFNALGGVIWERQGLRPFAQVRFTLLDGESAVALTAGVIFDL